MASSLYLVVSRVMPLLAADRGFAVLAPKFAVVALAAAVTYLVPSYAMKVPEAKIFIGRVRDIMARSLNLT
jgi:hypothetical protein